jgi:uncharacterized protein YdeI (YjbR/CyaY-like superfamily)
MEIEIFYPTSNLAWRQWLTENHNLKPSIWLLCYKKETNIPTISWSDAVDEALCFGWIDSTRKSRNDGSFIQFFTKRKPKSVWSKINKEKVQKLSDAGLMTEAGYKCIEIAKMNGSWDVLNDVEALIVPEDLELEFSKFPNAKEYYLALSKSVRKILLHRLLAAKRAETRQKRIAEIIEFILQKNK